MRAPTLLLTAFAILLGSLLVPADARTATQSQCEGRRDGCYQRCAARYGKADNTGDAQMNCGIRTCDHQFAHCMSQVKPSAQSGNDKPGSGKGKGLANPVTGVKGVGTGGGRGKPAIGPASGLKPAGPSSFLRRK